jgi:hypothetical protein
VFSVPSPRPRYAIAPERITQRQAAEILGCHVSLIGKLVARGALTSYGGRGSLSREQVQALAAFRRAAAEVVKPEHIRKPHRPPRTSGRPPDADHDWLRTREAAAFMGVSRPAISQRARRGRLPYVEHEGRRWFRRDHLELVKHADLVKLPTPKA